MGKGDALPRKEQDKEDQGERTQASMKASTVDGTGPSLSGQAVQTVKRATGGNKAPKNAANDTNSGKTPGWVMVVSVGSGLIFLASLLIIAILVPHPTPSQIFVFRVALSLAAAAFGATIPGFLQVNLPLWGKGLISATGALGLFVVVYLVNPPALIADPSHTRAEEVETVEIIQQPLAGAILDENGNPLADVQVSLPEFNVAVRSDDLGNFSFKVGAPKQATVRIMAQKDGFVTRRQDVTLGNTGLTFKMERKKP